jgi:hypothetical protein
MTALIIVGCVTVAAVVAWGLTMTYATADAVRLREEATREIRHWQAVAERAMHHAGERARDAATWAAGHQQGRDDTIAIIQMIAEAHELRADLGSSAAEMTDRT